MAEEQVKEALADELVPIIWYFLTVSTSHFYLKPVIR